MNWYSGNIAEAVALSKEKNAIFVVYVEGNDELSQKLRGFINNEKIKSKLETDNFVAIRLEGGSTAYMQFAQIYQLVPLPSLFFIGKNGTPLEVATGIISSVDELDAKIEKVLKLAGLSHEDKNKLDDETKASTSINQSSPTSTSVKPVATASADFISNEKQANVNTKEAGPSSDIVCDGDVCIKQTKNENNENKEFSEKSEIEEAEKSNLKKETQETVKTETKETSSQNKNDAENKLEHAKKLLEEKRKERSEEEARLEREREIRRRKEGQEFLIAKKYKQDLELQQLKEKIQKDKQEEQAARQRILEQIAADRAERAQKMNISGPTSSKSNDTLTTQKQSPKAEGQALEFSRIQFRKQNGETEMHNFSPSDQFKIVRDFVRNTILDGKYKEFSLATTFPRREFTTDDDTKTLQELDLYPSSVLLVLIPTITSTPAAVVARTGGFINVFNTLFWGMLSPIFYVFNYVKGFITGRRPPSTSTTNNNPTTSGQKRTNSNSVADDVSKKRNIDRLQSNELIDDGPSTGVAVKNKSLPYKRVGNSNVHRLSDKKDSDDENNTWNGNSTQQQ